MLKALFNRFVGLIAIGLLAAIGTFLIKAASEADVDMSSVEQYVMDWNHLTYTKIDIDHNAKEYDMCKDGYVPIFSASWPGSKRACDCSNNPMMDYWNFGIHVDRYCDYEREKYCRNVEENPRQDMPIVNENIVCGKANGPSFAQALRPNPVTKSCPKGTQPCSKLTSPENTICVTMGPELKKICPITSLVVKHNSEVDSFLSSSKATWKKEDWDKEYAMLWSQDFDSLPITSQLIEKKPCMNPHQSSIYDGYTPFEAERGFSTCEKSDLNGLTYDPRYQSTGLTVDLDQLHHDNGVMKKLTRSFDKKVFDARKESNKRKSQVLSLWTRPALSWKLECDADDSESSRFHLFEAIDNHYSFPQRITVAGVLAFVCLGIELMFCICGATSQYRLMANVVSGLIVANMAWMAATGAQTLGTQIDTVESYAMVNTCSDGVIKVPIEDLKRKYLGAYQGSNLATYLTFGLLAIYFLSCLVVRPNSEDKE